MRVAGAIAGILKRKRVVPVLPEFSTSGELSLSKHPAPMAQEANEGGKVAHDV